MIASSTGAIADPPVTDDLVMDLESNAIAVAVDAPVTTWIDQSTKGNSLTAGSSAPTFNVEKGVSSVAFSVDQILDADGFPVDVGDSMERLSAINGLPTGNADRTVILMADYDGKSAGFGYGNDIANQGFSTVTDGSGNLALRGWIDENDFPSTERGRYAGWLVHTAVLEAGGLRQYKDGRLIDVATHTFDTARDGMKARLGADLSNTRFAEMKVAAVLVYDRALTDAQRQSVEQFLQTDNLGFIIPAKVRFAKARLQDATGNPVPVSGPAVTLNYRLSGSGYEKVRLEVVGDPSTVQIVEKDADGILPNDVTFNSISDGNYTIKATLLDTNGDSLTPDVSNTMDVIVSSGNPVAGDDTGTAITGEQLSVDVVKNDVDLDGSINPATVKIIRSPDFGVVKANSDGTVDYKSNTGFVGTDSFTYTVEDNLGFESNEATVSMTVSAANSGETGSNTGGSTGGGTSDGNGTTANTANTSTGGSGGGAFNPLFLSLFALAGLVRNRGRKSA
ncbi:MAG: Ig-like domain-containing protein [Pseudomonadota bacterium]|nr:Ig-like domain-containing protein [Pseudomonadota bacterium]